LIDDDNMFTTNHGGIYIYIYVCKWIM
jgi:hypothetical protein